MAFFFLPLVPQYKQPCSHYASSTSSVCGIPDFCFLFSFTHSRTSLLPNLFIQNIFLLKLLISNAIICGLPLLLESQVQNQYRTHYQVLKFPFAYISLCKKLPYFFLLHWTFNVPCALSVCPLCYIWRNFTSQVFENCHLLLTPISLHLVWCVCFPWQSIQPSLYSLLSCICLKSVQLFIFLLQYVSLLCYIVCMCLKKRIHFERKKQNNIVCF